MSNLVVKSVALFAHASLRLMVRELAGLSVTDSCRGRDGDAPF